MRKPHSKRICSLLITLTLLTPMMTAALAQSAETAQPEAVTLAQPNLGATSVELITQDGYQFKDLNKNGTLDPYEDWRLSAEARAADLLSQMTSEDKAAQMLHITLVTLKENWFNELDIGFALAYNYLSEGAEAAARKTNEIQSLAETSRLGIPVVFSMDSVIGASWVDGATVLPDEITLAATGDAETVRALAQIQNEEMRAIGLRMSLSPVADLATDPRWGRVQECFGEDAATATAMVVAAIDGLQQGSDLTPDSVMACVKHFPGSGSQTAGVDGTPLVYDDDTFKVALDIFRAAIEAGAASIMPYGYSTVPYLGGDAVDNYAHESATVMTELLRGKLGYKGIIQTDWGLSPTAAAVAGADALGGASQREISKIVDALTEEQLNEKVSKLLVAKFKLGVFENPYVDVDQAIQVLGDPSHKEAVKEAAQKALTLVKYENITPLAGQKLVVAGSLAEDGHALSSGWTVDNYQAKNILTAIQEQAGADNVTYIGDDASLAADSVTENTTAIVVVGEASGTHEPEWGTSTLVFPNTQTDLLKALKKAGATVVTVVLMNRAYVMTEVAANSDAVLLAYRPGMSSGADAIAETLFGKHAINGRTPFQIPASMDQVLAQREDVAKDIVDPLFDYGYGMDAEAFGQ
jgi:beta-glucosidase